MEQRLAHTIRELLGVRLVAVIAGVTETREVHQWAEGTRPVPADVQGRLRIAHEAVRLIIEVESVGVAQAWMQGLNPILNDRSPAMVLREGPATAGRDVLVAARHLVGHG